jgi:hypothetical protein
MSWQGDDKPQFRKREAPTWQPHGEPPAGQPYGDQQPVWQGQPPPQFQSSPPTDGLAIASLILSISSFIVLPLIGSIAGVVCGHMARGRHRRATHGGESGGLALAGVIIGWIGIAFYVGIVALFVVALGLTL